VWEGIPVYVTSLNADSWEAKPAEYLHILLQENQLKVTKVSLDSTLVKNIQNT
jgi:hypothetical protein